MHILVLLLMLQTAAPAKVQPIWPDAGRAVYPINLPACPSGYHMNAKYDSCVTDTQPVIPQPCADGFHRDAPGKPCYRSLGKLDGCNKTTEYEDGLAVSTDMACTGYFTPPITSKLTVNEENRALLSCDAKGQWAEKDFAVTNCVLAPGHTWEEALSAVIHDMADFYRMRTPHRKPIKSKVYSCKRTRRSVEVKSDLKAAGKGNMSKGCGYLK